MPPPSDIEEQLAQWRLPGLNQAEHEVAHRWLEKNGRNYDRIEWNVPLGPKVDFPFEMTDAQRAQAEFLYSSRADIVAWLGDDHATILEVKYRLTKSAMGQLAHYVYWFQQQHPGVKVIARAIANYADRGIAESTLANGVDLELYGDPE